MSWDLLSELSPNEIRERDIFPEGFMPLPHPKAFPGRTPTRPVRMDLGELFPLASHFHVLMPVSFENPSAYGLSYGIEMLMHSPVNSLLSSFGDIKQVERLYQSFHFMVGFAVELHETHLFDDIVLPFPRYLER